MKGIEPSYAAWEAAVLPLNYTRFGAESSSTILHQNRSIPEIEPSGGCQAVHEATLPTSLADVGLPIPTFACWEAVLPGSIPQRVLQRIRPACQPLGRLLITISKSGGRGVGQ